MSYSNTRLPSATGVTPSNDDQLGPGHVRGAALRARSGSTPSGPRLPPTRAEGPASRAMAWTVVLHTAGAGIPPGLRLVRVPRVPARRIVGYAAVYGLAGSLSTCTCTGVRGARRVCGAFDG